jgi:hypothetical protein
MAVATLVVGQMRVGKTAWVVQFIIKEFLPYRDGRVYFNLPLLPGRIADYCSRDVASRLRITRAKARELVMSRLVPIPREVYERWEDGKECPGVWFGEDDQNGVPRIGTGDCIFLDEAHEVIPRSIADKDPVLQDWRNFIGFLGHPVASLYLITQDQWGIHEDIRSKCSSKFALSSLELQKDSFTGCIVKDQWELIAKLRASTFWRKDRAYVGGFAMRRYEWVSNQYKEVPHIPADADRGTAAVMDQIYRFRASWFDCYKSHSQRDPNAAEFKRELMQWERDRWPWFLRWFIQRNSLVLSKWCGLGVGVLAVFFALFVLRIEPLSWSMNLITKAMQSTPVTPAVPPGSPSAQQAAAQAVPKPSTQQISNDVAAEVVNRALFDSAVVLMAEKHVVFDDGALVRVGEEIPNGVHAGTKIKAVDLGRQLVQLESGRVLRFQAQRTIEIGTTQGDPNSKVRPGRPAPDQRFNRPGTPGSANGQSGVSRLPAEVGTTQSAGVGSGNRARSGSGGKVGNDGGIAGGAVGIPRESLRPDRLLPDSGEDLPVSAFEGSEDDSVRNGPTADPPGFIPITKRVR